MPGTIKDYRWKPESAAIRRVRDEREANKRALARQLEADPDVRRYHEEREKHPRQTPAELLEAKAEFDRYMASITGSKGRRSGKRRCRGIWIPTSERARILNAIDNAALSAMGQQRL